MQRLSVKNAYVDIVQLADLSMSAKAFSAHARRRPLATPTILGLTQEGDAPCYFIKAGFSARNTRR